MKYFFLMFILFSYLSTSAQTQSIFNEIRIGPYFTSEMSTVSVGSLNNYLSSKSYFACSNTSLNRSYGISIRSISNPSLINLTFCRSESSMDKVSGNSMINSNGMRMEYLYDLINNEKWLIAPSISYQFSNYQLMAVSQDVFSPLTGDNLEESAHVFSKDLVSVGLVIDRQICIKFIDFFIGLHVCYNFNIAKNSWLNSNYEELVKLPEINLSGVCIGFSGRMEINQLKLKGII